LTTATDELEENARTRVATAATQALNLAPDLSERARDFLADLGSHA
jgi:hypothetical protein